MIISIQSARDTLTSKLQVAFHCSRLLADALGSPESLKCDLAWEYRKGLVEHHQL